MQFELTEELQLVDKLVSIGTRQTCSRGDIVYSEGDQSSCLFFVSTGLVGLTKVTTSGNENLLRIFKSGQFFGHRSLFSSENYHASAKCLEPSQIISIEKSQVLAIFDENPKSYFFLARALAIELRRAENRSILVAEAQILERVSMALILLTKLYPNHLWTRTEIANYCATRTPTVIKALKKLENQRLIKQIGRKIEIINEESLINSMSEVKVM